MIFIAIPETSTYRITSHTAPKTILQMFDIDLKGSSHQRHKIDWSSSGRV